MTETLLEIAPDGLPPISLYSEAVPVMGDTIDFDLKGHTYTMLVARREFRVEDEGRGIVYLKATIFGRVVNRKPIPADPV